MRNTLIGILSIPVMIFSYKEALQLIPTTVQGVVIEQSSGKPVNKAHVYTIRGEEEVLSRTSGEFSIATWQKLPVTVVIEHKDYETVKVTVRNSSDKLIVKLLKRSSD